MASRREDEVLERLEALFGGGFAELTMADIAAEAGCSLRLLYRLAGSRDELVRLVVDRSLRRIGRAATDARYLAGDPIEAIRAYLATANRAVSQLSPAFAADLFAVASTRELADHHASYLARTTEELVTEAIQQNWLPPTDPAALATVLAGMGPQLGAPAANRLTGQILDALALK